MWQIASEATQPRNERVILWFDVLIRLILFYNFICHSGETFLKQSTVVKN